MNQISSNICAIYIAKVYRSAVILLFQIRGKQNKNDERITFIIYSLISINHVQH